MHPTSQASVSAFGVSSCRPELAYSFAQNQMAASLPQGLGKKSSSDRAHLPCFIHKSIHACLRQKQS